MAAWMLAQSPPKLLRSWGAADLMDLEARGLLGNRLGRLEVQEKSLARVGREVSRAIDFKIQLAQDSLRLYVDAKTGGFILAGDYIATGHLRAPCTV